MCVFFFYSDTLQYFPPFIIQGKTLAYIALWWLALLCTGAKTLHFILWKPYCSLCLVLSSWPGWLLAVNRAACWPKLTWMTPCCADPNVTSTPTGHYLQKDCKHFSIMRGGDLLKKWAVSKPEPLLISVLCLLDKWTAAEPSIHTVAKF